MSDLTQPVLDALWQLLRQRYHTAAISQPRPGKLELRFPGVSSRLFIALQQRELELQVMNHRHTWPFRRYQQLGRWELEEQQCLQQCLQRVQEWLDRAGAWGHHDRTID